ncbi:hypothetical protein SAMN05428960_1023 [Mitsuaria sp. PDC51]|uniref:hypothetical protein n=1 Tax=Mitsuaria sp. PDC51 TaxID=1881035 RepID=UPI0008DEEACF|nr:hypothetical protein [Mitsuaria sp. PDC51]SFR74852.1 hypothetical protein SAMN05428960_1023 [Mitsuaria sp. PDC51]
MPQDTKIARPPLYIQADALKGRGSGWAMPHRFESREREQYDDGWGTLDQTALEEHVAPRTEIIEEQARKILSGNQSPDIGFDLSINPYRGCEHVMRTQNVWSSSPSWGGGRSF